LARSLASVVRLPCARQDGALYPLRRSSPTSKSTMWPKAVLSHLQSWLSQGALHSSLPQKTSGGSCSAHSLSLVSFGSQQVHPAKKLNEDSFFICGNSLGVSDGVGGVSMYGIDPSQFSRDLMLHAHHCFKMDELEDPVQVLHESYDRIIKGGVQGSSTACLVSLSKNVLKAAVVGDSTFMIIRKNRIIFRSPPQQHYFNCPYQLSSFAGGDHPCDAQSIEYPLRTGDVVIVATDGLFDNLFEGEILEVIAFLNNVLSPTETYCVEQYLSTACQFSKEAAFQLVQAAHSASLCKKTDTPFSVSARNAGYHYVGGKPDDITVLVSVAVPSARV